MDPRRTLVALAIALSYCCISIAQGNPESAETNGPATPQGLMEAFAEAVHQVEPVEDEAAFWAQNPGSRLHFRFDDTGMTVTPFHDGEAPWSLNMRLIEIGQPGAMTPVQDAEFSRDGRRIREFVLRMPPG